MKNPKLSFVIPCYNEENCLAQLHARVKAVAEQVAPDAHEIVLINDGSSDATWRMMQQLSAMDPALVTISLSRNHGHQIALSAGLDLCTGDRVLILDADLQDPPELAAAMMALMDEQGADVVYGQRSLRHGENWFKLGTSKIFYRLLDKFSDISIPVDTGDFRLVSRRALDAFLSLPENQRYLRGMFAWIGFKQVPLQFERAERLAGETKYPLSKMIYLALNAMTGFSTAPLRFASHMGLLLTIGSIACLGYVGISWATGRAVPGWASMMLVMVLVSGVQLLVLGMIGEYLGKLFIESKRRPLYIVADIEGPMRGHATLGYVPRSSRIEDGEEIDAAAPVPRISGRPMRG